MQPDNLDDLFRQQLGGHATPPPADLWARLQASQQPEAAEPLDLQFQVALGDHATPPRREVWERLEDEHLRPRPHRRRPVVAWWQLSAAAVLLLTLVGGGLWRGGFLGHPAGSGIATATNKKPGMPGNEISMPEKQGVAAPTTALVVAPEKKNQEIFATQATAPTASPSSTPIASTTRPPRPATTTPRGARSHSQQQPDAATAQLAHTGGRKTPASQQPRLPVAPATPAPETPALAVAPAPAAPQVIEVEVRRGSRPAPAPAVVAAADAEPASDQRPRRGLGNLLRRAGRLAQDQAAGLADATGLPDNLTVQARLGGRTLSKTIQL